MTLTPHEVAELIEACAFDVANLTEWPIQRHGVVMGEIVWDNCECGQLVISEVRRFPSTLFPTEDSTNQDACGTPWLVVQYTLSLTRCIPVMDDNGNPPSIAALAASAERNSLDMTNVRHAVLCCLDEQYRTYEISAWQLGAMEVTGPAGMCGGFDFTIMVGFTNDCECSGDS